MEIYLLLFLSILFVGITKFKYRFEFIAIILFLFHAFRFDVGYDFLSYYTTIVNYYDGDWTYLRFGVIHGFLVEISNKLGFYQLYFIITSGIIIYFLHKSIKDYSNDYLYSILIFMAIPFFFLSSLCYIRQFTAMMIILYVSKHIVNNNFKIYFIWIVIASLFHFTALSMMILYFINKLKINKIILLALFSSSFFLYPIFSELVKALVPQYSAYLNLENATSHGRSFQFFINILLFVFIIFFYDFLKKNKNSYLYFMAYFIGVIIYNIFQPVGFVATRLSYYFLIYMIFLIPFVSLRFRKKQFIIIIIIISFLIYITSLILSSKIGSRSPNIPYKTFFGKNITDARPYGWIKEK